MKISTASSKMGLFKLFYVDNPRAQFPGQPLKIAKDFDVADVIDAGSAKKKLVTRFEGKDGGQYPIFEDGEIEFDPAEITVLKKLFDAQKKWSADEADIYQELKDIFNPPKK